MTDLLTNAYELTIEDNWTRVTVALFNATDPDNLPTTAPEPLATTTITITITIPRYAAPYTAIATSLLSFEVHAADETPAATSLRWSEPSNGIYSGTAPTTVNYTTGSYTFSNSDNTTDNNYNPISTYIFRSVGNAKFPSLPCTYTTARYIMPAIEDYVPFRTGASGFQTGYMSGLLVFGPTEGTNRNYIYINHTHHVTSDPNSDLVDPNPYDASTYDDAYPSGTRIDNIGYPKFKMVAGPAVTSGNSASTALNDRATHLLASTVVSVDTDYAPADIFCHRTPDGVLHYLSYDASNNTFYDATTFSYDCLWMRDARNNYLYHRSGGTNHCLGSNTNNQLVIHDGGASSDKWFRIGHRMALNGNSGLHIAFDENAPDNACPWKIIGHNAPNVDTSVVYTAYHQSKQGFTFHSLANFSLSRIRVSTTSGNYAPRWISLDQHGSYTLSVEPSGQINTYQLPAHDHFYFQLPSATDPNIFEKQHMFYYRGASYTLITDPEGPSNPQVIPSIQGTESFSSSHISYQWELLNTDETTSTAATLGANGSNSITLSAANVDQPTKLLLKVTATYSDLTANSDGEPVSGTAVSVPLTLFAEHSLPLASLTSVPNSTETAPVLFSNYSNGNTYLLQSFDPVNNTHYYLTANGSATDGYTAVLTTEPDPERLLYVTLEGTDLKLYSPALATENDSPEQYYMSTADNTGINYYRTDHPAVSFISGGSTNARLFTPKVYQNNTGATYFTLQPNGANEGISLQPQVVDNAPLRAENRSLRRINSLTSRYQSLQGDATAPATSQSSEESFYATRWQLVDPTLIKPVITMTPDGNITVTDLAGHLRHVGGTLYYRVKPAPTTENPEPAWGDWQTHTLMQPSYPGGCDCDESSIRVASSAAVGLEVQAYKTSGPEHSHYAPSCTTSFIVRRTPTPSISVSGHDIIITAVADNTVSPVIPDQDQQLLYAIGNADPAEVPSYRTLDGHRQGIVPDLSILSANRSTAPDVTPYAVAENCLISDAPTPLTYQPRLELGLKTVANPGNNIYILAYVGDPSTPENNYTDWETATNLVNYEFPNPEPADETDPTIHKYVIRYTLTGQDVTDENNNIITSAGTAVWDPTAQAYRIPVVDGYAQLKAQAFPITDGTSLYEQSNQIAYNFNSQYYTFYAIDTVGTTYTTHSFSPGFDGNNPTGNIADNPNSFIKSCVWIAAIDTATPTAIRSNNESGNQYLVLHRNQDGTRFNLATSPVRQEGQVGSGSTAFFATSSWNWSGEALYDESTPMASRQENYTKYKCYTTIGSDRYYIVFDRQLTQWTVVKSTDINNTYTANEVTQKRYNPNILFRTRIWDFPESQDFLDLSAQLQLKNPDNNQWVTVSERIGADHDISHGWVALAEGDELDLRVRFSGNQLTYPGNEVVYIVRPPLDNNEPESHVNSYIPWQYWVDYPDDGQSFTQTPVPSQTSISQYFSDLSTIVWCSDDGLDNNNQVITTPKCTTTQNGGLVPASGVNEVSTGVYPFNNYFNFRANAEPGSITLIRNNYNTGTFPNFDTRLKAKASQRSVFAAGLPESGVTYDLSIHLFAETKDNRSATTGSNDALSNTNTGQGEYPTFAGGKRWRFLSKSYNETSGSYHYLSSDHHTNTTIGSNPSSPYKYLANQPDMGTNPEYTHYAIWIINSPTTTTDGHKRYVTITPAIAQQKKLVHLPGNATDYEDNKVPGQPSITINTGDELNPTQTIADASANGLYLFDPQSFEAEENDHAALSNHSEDFQHFAIRQFKSGDEYYVTLSPFYRASNGTNMAGYLSLANEDGEDSWVRSNFGSVPQNEDPAWTLQENRAACLASATNAFWRTRWHMQQALLTPPYVEMNPEGQVSLWHRLENVTLNSNSSVQDIHSILKFYYTVNNSDASGNLPDNAPEPAFLNNNALITDQTPVANMTPAEGTLLYNPAQKPELEEGQWITVVAVLTDDLSTENFDYVKHISRPHHFKAVKSEAPDWQSPTDRHNVVFNLSDGDTLLVGRNVETLTYSDYGVVEGVSRYTASNVYDLQYNPETDDPMYIWRAFQHNKLQSDPLYLYKEQPLNILIVGIPTIANDIATVTVRVLTANEHHPALPSHYDLKYSTQPLDGEGHIQWNNPASNNVTVTQSPTDENLYTFSVPLTGTDANSQTTYLGVPFRVQATPKEGETMQFYTESDVELRFLIHPNYTGNRADMDGQGTQADPYIIHTHMDLITYAILINGGGTGNYGTAWYKLTDDIDMLSSVSLPSIGTSTNPFTGHFNGSYHSISNLKNPLFGVCGYTDQTTNPSTVYGAHIYNVVIDHSKIECNISGAVGALCNTAKGNTRIYNSGFRSTGGYSLIKNEDGVAGGLVGLLDENARVVNCYNFANVESTANASSAAGIVAVATADAQSTKDNQKGIVFACVNYAKVTANSVYPVVVGSPTVISGNLNTYNYFNADAKYDVAKLQYDGSFGNEEWALNRVEMVRYILNSNNRRAGWWVNAPNGDNGGNASGLTNEQKTAKQTQTLAYFTDVIATDGETIGQWVLDTNIAPYPILKPRYDNNHNPIQYPSIINPDYEADWRGNANPYEGRRLSDWGANGKLTVTFSPGTIGTTTPSLTSVLPNHATATNISITDMDTLAYDFNYAKIQLPYFQDLYGTGSNIQTVNNLDYIVTGWKITSITKDGTPVTSVTRAEVNAFTYNYANRDSIVKDLYHTFTKDKDAYGNNLSPAQRPARVFAQGGYFNVPNGVTAITIEPYWGRAFYLMESNNDVYYTDNNSTGGGNLSTSVQANSIYGSATRDLVTSQTIYNNTGDLLTAMASSTTVYDQAIVLLTDFHYNNNTKSLMPCLKVTGLSPLLPSMRTTTTSLTMFSITISTKDANSVPYVSTTSSMPT